MRYSSTSRLMVLTLSPVRPIMFSTSALVASLSVSRYRVRLARKLIQEVVLLHSQEYFQ